MQTEKIAFIICVNNERAYEECLFYINKLEVPTDFLIEVYTIRDANSIYEAYNQAMNQSDAKYKVYIHQDVFLINKNILIDAICMFKSNPQIGMIGLLGGKHLPESRRFYRSWDTGNVIGCSDKKAFWNELGTEQSKVFAIDGMFMMTQYDIPWREDVLTGWDFYDFSQSLEFGRRGYEVWVMNQSQPSSLHDCGYLNFMSYDKSQQEFLKLYAEDFPDYSDEQEIYPLEHRKQFEVFMELKEEIKKLLFLGKEKEVCETFQTLWDERFYDTELAILKNIFEILQKETETGEDKEQGFLKNMNSYIEVYEKYIEVKYHLWRQRYANEESIDMPYLSNSAIWIIRNHCML